MRVLFRRIHLIASLGAGLWLALSGLSGSVLLFGDWLDPAIHPELYRVERPGERVPVETIIGAAEAAAEGEVLRIRLAGESTPVHEVWIDCDQCRRVWVDPSTGTVNGVRGHDGTIRLWLHELHRRMMLGDAGEIAVGSAGLGLVVILISGVFLWVPTVWRRAFRLHLSKGWKVATHDLHRMGGLVIAPLLLVSALTGIYFVFHGAIDATLQRWISPGVMTESALPSFQPGRSTDEIITDSTRLFEHAEPTWVTPAAEGTVVVRLRQAFEAHPNGRTFVSIDPASGRVTRIIDPSRASAVSTLINELYPLHIGRSGGTIHRLILAFVGLTPSIFLVTGLLMWWNRSLRRAVRPGRTSSRLRSDLQTRSAEG